MIGFKKKKAQTLRLVSLDEMCGLRKGFFWDRFANHRSFVYLEEMCVDYTKKM